MKLIYCATVKTYKQLKSGGNDAMKLNTSLFLIVLNAIIDELSINKVLQKFHTNKLMNYTFFFKKTRFPRQVQCFLKFLQFEPEMFLRCLSPLLRKL